MTTKTRTVRYPQPIEESRMQGYFMISKRDAAVVITKKLTGSQCRLWLYLMLIDPFADYTADGEVKYHDLPSVAEIAVAIGGSVESVEKDLRKLRSLGLYEYRTVVIQGHNTTAANARAEADRLKSQSKSKPKPSQDNRSAYLSPKEDYLSPKEDYLSPEEAYLNPEGDYLNPEGDYLSPDQQLEPLPRNNFGALQTNQTNQTYQNFLSDLSNGERENFEKFALTKVKQLPNVPTLPQRWIEVHFEELRSQWEKSQGKVSATQANKWENHPEREEWLEKIRKLGQFGFFAESKPEEQERREFYKWADSKNLVWGEIPKVNHDQPFTEV
ncbi:hypothetical protein [Anabaena sp. UHCC 0187]|uniref:hypothetical protein n=1 Tax=Anabaena sp. UHCC 0187 TaxID=2590018 RepID=UPI001580D8BE|nr:hypothetical protein [Anabaena sp. UHCC 0187]